MTIDIDIIWTRIEKHVGEQFETKTGKPFKYEILNDSVIPDRTDFALDKKQFSKACDVFPIDGPGEISNLVMGSSYVWAILHDKRIRKKDW